MTTTLNCKEELEKIESSEIRQRNIDRLFVITIHKKSFITSVYDMYYKGCTDHYTATMKSLDFLQR